MWTLIMCHNRFCENENEAVETHIPRHRDSKTKKPRHRDSKTKKPRHRDSKTKKPRHREMETTKPRPRDSKAFFQRTKSHDIEIPRLKNQDIKIPRPKSHDIEVLWNSDPYAPLILYRHPPMIATYKFTTLCILPHPILSTKSIKTKAILFRFDDIILNIEESYILTRLGRNEKNTTYKQIFVQRPCYGERIMFEI